MNVVTLVPLRLVHFHLDAMRIGPGVLTDAGDLPGNLHPGFAGLDGKAAVRHFYCDDSLRELADHRQLITEIGVESLEPRGHGDDGCATAVGDHVAVVDVHHVGRFDEGVVEIFVRGIEWMIDLKGAAGFAERASNIHVAIEIAGVKSAATGRGVYSITSAERSSSPIRFDAVTAECSIASGGRDAIAAKAERPGGVAAVGINTTPARITLAVASSAQRI